MKPSGHSPEHESQQNLLTHGHLVGIEFVIIGSGFGELNAAQLKRADVDQADRARHHHLFQPLHAKWPGLSPRERIAPADGSCCAGAACNVQVLCWATSPTSTWRGGIILELLGPTKPPTA